MKNIIRAIIREQIELLFESFEMKNEKKTFVPTDNVAKTAKTALEAIAIAEKNGIKPISSDESGNQGSGRQKAVRLAEKEKQNFSEMKRLKAFFESNAPEVEQERKRLGIIQQRKGTINEMENSSILLVWNLHGGDACKEWVNAKLSDTHEKGLNKKKNYRAAGGNIELGKNNPNDGFGALTYNHNIKHRIHR